MATLCKNVLALFMAVYTFSVHAADRAQNIRFEELQELSMASTTHGGHKGGLTTLLTPGEILGYDVYRKSIVIKRDALTGIVSLDIEGQTVRIRPDTREILDIAG